MDMSFMFGKNYSPVSIPESYTNNPAKRFFYSIDSFYIESVRDFQSDKLLHFLEEGLLTSIVFLPEAIVGRKIGTAMELLYKEGFTLVAYSRFRFNRHMIRENWRYQYNTAIQQRIDAADLLRTATDSLYVMLKKNCVSNDTASFKLKSMKGASDPEQRKKSDLRYVLGDLCYLLSIVHTPDDTSDFIREFGVYLDKDRRCSLLKYVEAESIDESGLNRLINDLYNEYEPEDLCFDRAVNRIENAINASFIAKQSNNYASQIQIFNDLSKQNSFDWSGFFNFLDESHVYYRHWDKLILISYLFNKHNANITGVERVI